jgi:hypothetical protein
MRIFGLLWLFLTGAAITIPASSSDSATKIGSTCIVTHLPEYLSVNGIAMTVYDTSVFLAISYRLLANSHVEQTPGEMTRALFRGAHLHAFSKTLFLDGQQYYLYVASCPLCPSPAEEFIHFPVPSLSFPSFLFIPFLSFFFLLYTCTE